MSTGHLAQVDRPAGWGYQRLDHVMQRVQEIGRPDLQPLSVFLGDGVVPRAERDDNYNRLGENLASYLIVQPGDVVFNKLRTWQGGLGVSAHTGIVSPAYFVLRPSKDAEARFLHHLLRSPIYLDELTRRSKWMPPSQFDITWDQLRTLPVLLPPLSTRRAIADFLDRKTGAIDELIRKKERLIELLQEKSQALITQAVTKGLDPSVPTKESGLPWLEEIPAHWEVHHLRRVVSRFVDYRGRTPAKADFGVPLITAGAIRDGQIDHDRAPEYIPEEDYDAWMQRGWPEVGDVVFTTEAPLGEVAQVQDLKVAFAQRVILFKANPARMRPSFLRLHFLGTFGHAEVESYASGSTALGIRADRLKRTLVPVPPLPEQDEIAVHVTATLERTRILVEKLHSQIAKLSEYRQTLTSAAVTGKLHMAEETQ